MLFRRLLQLLLASALLLAVLSPAASAHRRRHRHHRTSAPVSCANADTPAAAASPDAMRAAVLCLVNAQRASRGLPALSANQKLDRAAQLWTNVVVSTGLFSHGSNFASRITAAGYLWSFVGENLATGYLTPREAVTAWMASRDHCRNILDPHFVDVGTGLATKPFGNFGSGTWAQDFGLPLGHPAPSGNSGPQSGCPY